MNQIFSKYERMSVSSGNSNRDFAEALLMTINADKTAIDTKRLRNEINSRSLCNLRDATEEKASWNYRILSKANRLRPLAVGLHQLTDTKTGTNIPHRDSFSFSFSFRRFEEFLRRLNVGSKQTAAAARNKKLKSCSHATLQNVAEIFRKLSF